MNSRFPNNLTSLHNEELSLREKAMTIFKNQPELLLHLNVVEHAMSLAKVVVDYPTDDEDFKVIKILGIRLFNAFGASLNLILSGYHQNGGLVMRDALEVLFLMDLFRTDHSAIQRWRLADRKTQRETFSPIAVRKALDERDGLNTGRRGETYKMFSELAAHPNMHSQHMLRSQQGGDILMGPFMENTTLDAGISEMGKLAVQAGEIISEFPSKNWHPEVRASFALVKKKWVETFIK